MECVCQKMNDNRGTMIRVSAFVFVAIAMANTGVDGLPFPRECEADHQCVNGFCYAAVGKCTPCIDCSVYLRNAPKWSSCAKSAQECGSCMSGYDEEVFQEGAKRDFCVPIKDSQKRYDDEDDKVALATVGYAVLGVSIVIILAVFTIVYIRKKIPRIKPSCLGRPHCEEETPPPPYSSSPLLPSAPVMSEAASNQLEVVEVKENLQQAVPFKVPVSLCNGYYENGDHDEESEVEEYHFGDSVLEVQDEDTLPSNWTPDVASGLGEEVITSGPSGEREDSSHDSRPESSLSSLSEAAASPASTDTSTANKRNTGDSGVSASSSAQSSNSSLAVRHFSQFGSGHRATHSGETPEQPLSRSRSEEDLNQSTQPCKRPRRDSGSVSMQSGPFYESDGSSSEDEGIQNSEYRGSTSNRGTQANQFNIIVNVHRDSRHVHY